MNNLFEPFVDRLTPKNKKYSVWVVKDGVFKRINFGDKKYEHYYDRIGKYSHLNHLDDERRRLYRARASNIRDKNGNLTVNDITSPNHWSYHYLW